jgi:Tfp pilus assembly protein PilN
MIKINLAAKKRSSASAGKGMGDTLRLDSSQLEALWAQARELPLQKIASVLIVGYGATFALNSYKSSLVAEQQAELDRVLAQKPALEAESRKMKGLQETQMSMESDEKRIRTKLDTIKKLVAGRNAATSVLEELSRITPQSVWISDFSMKGSDLSFKGYSQDFANISDFTRQIQNSAMFTGMILKDTQMANDDQKRQIASFSVTARRR